jgi:hypothetical protein
MLGDDFRRTVEEAERLRTESHEASENLMIHWRQNHEHPSEPEKSF